MFTLKFSWWVPCPAMSQGQLVLRLLRHACTAARMSVFQCIPEVVRVPCTLQCVESGKGRVSWQGCATAPLQLRISQYPLA